MAGFQFEELAWDAVIDDIQAVDEQFAEIIRAIKPAKNFSFIKMRYQYGDFILKKGELHLPYDGSTLPIGSHKIPDELKRKLGYSSVPMGLILNKTVEVFFETEDRCMPSKVFEKGTIFGLWEAFDREPSEFIKKVWNLTAGTRSVFMLPKISDTVSHNRLKRDYAVCAYPPKTLLGHHGVFTEIAKKARSDWHCDVLFFTKDWLMDQDNLLFVKLHKRWLREAWNQSYNCRSQMSYDAAWEEFSKELSRRNYKPRAGSINVIKHLITIGEGTFPGFIPALEDESALPLALIQKAYKDSYSLKNYAPIIMHPHHMKKKGESVYYSLSMPTQPGYFAQTSAAPSIMGDLRELKQLIGILQNLTLDKMIEYHFFHSDKDAFGEIRQASDIPLEDRRFDAYFKKYQESWFCDNSHFWRGCIRIDSL